MVIIELRKLRKQSNCERTKSISVVQPVMWSDIRESHKKAFIQFLSIREHILVLVIVYMPC